MALPSAALQLRIRSAIIHYNKMAAISFALRSIIFDNRMQPRDNMLATQGIGQLPLQIQLHQVTKKFITENIDDHAT